ncbi:MAG: DUF5320 domain-containing protein [Marinilabilia sp.]
MPAGDKTGPLGQGSRTGRGKGFCSGNSVPGYANDEGRMGAGRGPEKSGRGARSGRGRKRGFGRGFG